MTVAEDMEKKLTSALLPTRLVIVDESAQHAGHVGARPEGETHFRVVVVSDRFAGMDRLARAREVHRILAEELAGPVHALSITARTPQEQGV